MKEVKQIWKCDRCGTEMDANGAGGWHMVEKGDYAYIGIKAMYSNCGVGSKYDLCRKCTLELAKQFIEKMSNGKQGESNESNN